MIMCKFIEYTDKSGVRAIISLNSVERVIDNRKAIRVVLADEAVHLAISYDTFKAWLGEAQSPILLGGTAL